MISRNRSGVRGTKAFAACMGYTCRWLSTRRQRGKGMEEEGDRRKEEKNEREGKKRAERRRI